MRAPAVPRARSGAPATRVLRRPAGGLHPPQLDVGYVPRPDLERRVAALLAAGRPVLLTGPALAGKTALAAAVVDAVAAGRPVLAPADAAGLAGLAARGTRDAVLWLDGLDAFLGPACTPAVLAALAAGNAVVATLGGLDAERLAPARDVAAPGADVVALFERVHVEPFRDPGDRAVPAGAVRARVASLGLGAHAAGAERIADTIDWAALRDPPAHALLAAAAQWRHAGLVRPVPAGTLVRLASSSMRAPARVGSAQWNEALTWAATPLAPGVALLRRSDAGYAVHSYVRERLACGAGAGPTAAGWELLLGAARPAELPVVAAAAAHDPMAEAALERVLGAAGHAGSVRAMTALAAVLERRPARAASARRWWRRAAAAGDPVALGRLGDLHAADGDAAAATDLYIAAAEGGDPAAMAGLARLDDAAGRPGAAAAWWARAAEAGHAGALHRRGEQAAAAGDSAAAGRCWRRAADLGDADAANDLGAWHRRRGDVAAAAERFASAARRGHLRAMVNLGVLLEDSGRGAEAEHWYGTAAAAGHVDAMNNLAGLRHRAGDADEARRWYTRAAECGDARAMYNLGLLLDSRGETGEARAWWGRARTAGHPRAAAAAAASRARVERRWRNSAADGDPGAMYDLGVLAETRGDLDAAEFWWRRAGTAGDPDATFNLAALLADRGRPDQAAEWYQAAAASGDADAMVNLAALRHAAGDAAGAQAWWARAAEAGHPRAMVALGAAAAETDDDVAAESWWRRAAGGGDAAAMHNLAVLLRDLGRRPEAEAWWRRAAAVRP